MSFVVTALASFAITYLTVYFDGPFDMLWHFRRLCGSRRTPILGIDGEQVGIIEEPSNKLSELVLCHWCFTTWVSLIVSSISIRHVDVLLWFACVAVSGVLHDYIGTRNR